VGILRSIRNRIGSVKNIQRITQAVKMVAEVRLQRAEKQTRAVDSVSYKRKEIPRNSNDSFGQIHAEAGFKKELTQAKSPEIPVVNIQNLERVGGKLKKVGEVKQLAETLGRFAALKYSRLQLDPMVVRKYMDSVNDIFLHLVAKEEDPKNPILEVFKERQIKKIAIIIITSDRGLCGQFNYNVIQEAVLRIQNNQEEKNDVKLICIGKKGYNYFKKRQTKVKYYELFNTFVKFRYDAVRMMARKIYYDFLNEPLGKVIMIYTQNKTFTKQSVCVEQLFPLPLKEILGIGNDISEVVSLKGLKFKKTEINQSVNQMNYIYEPTSDEIFKKIIPVYVEMLLSGALIKSNAAEQAARMVAMEKATENAAQLMHILQLYYNKARQASITKELLEIVSGAEALKSSE
jgi:F-type H+-transporting ATPase subunit gamma